MIQISPKAQITPECCDCRCELDLLSTSFALFQFQDIQTYTGFFKLDRDSALESFLGVSGGLCSERLTLDNIVDSLQSLLEVTGGRHASSGLHGGSLLVTPQQVQQLQQQQQQTQSRQEQVQSHQQPGLTFTVQESHQQTAGAVIPSSAPLLGQQHGFTYSTAGLRLGTSAIQVPGSLAPTAIPPAALVSSLASLGAAGLSGLAVNRQQTQVSQAPPAPPAHPPVTTSTSPGSPFSLPTRSPAPPHAPPTPSPSPGVHLRSPATPLLPTTSSSPAPSPYHGQLQSPQYHNAGGGGAVRSPAPPSLTPVPSPSPQQRAAASPSAAPHNAILHHTASSQAQVVTSQVTAVQAQTVMPVMTPAPAQHQFVQIIQQQQQQSALASGSNTIATIATGRTTQIISNPVGNVMAVPMQNASKTKQPPQILPKPPSSGGTSGSAAKSRSNSTGSSNNIPTTPIQTQSTTQLVIGQTNQTATAVIPAAPASLLYPMMNSLGTSTQPVFIQQQASGGVQLILRSQQQTTGAAPTQVQSAPQPNSGKPMVLGSSGNLASPSTVFIAHPQATRPQAPTPSFLRILTTQGPLLQQIQTPTYIALPPGQLNIQHYAQLPSAAVQQKVMGLQQSQITTSLAGQLQVPVSMAGLTGQSIIGLANLDQSNANDAGNSTLTMPVTTTTRVEQNNTLSCNDKTQTLPLRSIPTANHTGNLESPQPKKKPKRTKKRNKRDEETKLDLASIMKISGIGDDDDLATYDSEEQCAVNASSHGTQVQAPPASQPAPLPPPPPPPPPPPQQQQQQQQPSQPAQPQINLQAGGLHLAVGENGRVVLQQSAPDGQAQTAQTGAIQLSVGDDGRVVVQQSLCDNSQAGAQSLTASAGAQLLLQSLASQAGQPRLYPGIAAAAHNQLSQLLGATASPPRQGVFLQQFLQNSLSATSTTTNLTKLATTGNGPDNTVTLPQAMSPPSQPVFQPLGAAVATAKTPVSVAPQAQLPPPQHQPPQSQAVTQPAGAGQANCTAQTGRIPQMTPPAPAPTPKQQTASGIPPLMEAAFLQYLQKAGVNTDNIVITQQNGVPTVVASHQLLQVLQQQAQLQQAQAQAQVQLQPQVQIQPQVQQVQQIQQHLSSPRWEAPKSQSVTLDTQNMVLSSIGKNGPGATSVRTAAPVTMPVVSSAPQNFLGTPPGLLLGGLQTSAPAVSLAATLGSHNDLGAQMVTSNSLGGTIIIGAPTTVSRATPTPTASVATTASSGKSVVSYPAGQPLRRDSSDSTGSNASSVSRSQSTEEQALNNTFLDTLAQSHPGLLINKSLKPPFASTAANTLTTTINVVSANRKPKKKKIPKLSVTVQPQAPPQSPSSPPFGQLPQMGVGVVSSSPNTSVVSPSFVTSHGGLPTSGVKQSTPPDGFTSVSRANTTSVSVNNHVNHTNVVTSGLSPPTLVPIPNSVSSVTHLASPMLQASFGMQLQGQSSQCTNQPTLLIGHSPGLPMSVPNSLATSISASMPKNIMASMPSSMPSIMSASMPTIMSASMPTIMSASMPTSMSASMPTSMQSRMPTSLPTSMPSSLATSMPTIFSTSMPTSLAVSMPTYLSASMPTYLTASTPSSLSSVVPTSFSTNMITSFSTGIPTSLSTSMATSLPTCMPTSLTSSMPSSLTASLPTSMPSSIPSNMPSSVPSSMPSSVPTNMPPSTPSSNPTNVPTSQATSQSQPIQRVSTIQTIQLSSKQQLQLKSVQQRIHALKSKKVPSPGDDLAIQKLLTEQQTIIWSGKIVPTVPTGQNLQVYMAGVAGVVGLSGDQNTPGMNNINNILSQAQMNQAPVVTSTAASTPVTTTTSSSISTPVRYHHHIGNQVITFTPQQQQQQPLNKKPLKQHQHHQQHQQHQHQLQPSPHQSSLPQVPSSQPQNQQLPQHSPVPQMATVNHNQQTSQSLQQQPLLHQQMLPQQQHVHQINHQQQQLLHQQEQDEHYEQRLRKTQQELEQHLQEEHLLHMRQVQQKSPNVEAMQLQPQSMDGGNLLDGEPPQQSLQSGSCEAPSLLGVNSQENYTVKHEPWESSESIRSLNNQCVWQVPPSESRPLTLSVPQTSLSSGVKTKPMVLPKLPVMSSPASLSVPSPSPTSVASVASAMSPQAVTSPASHTLMQESTSPTVQPPPPPPPPPQQPAKPLPLPRVLIEKRLKSDREAVYHPDVDVPFRSKKDAIERLLPFHLYNEELLSLQDLEKADEIYEATAKHLLVKLSNIMNKFKSLMLLESMREVNTNDIVMMDRMQEQWLKEDAKKAREEEEEAAEAAAKAAEEIEAAAAAAAALKAAEAAEAAETAEAAESVVEVVAAVTDADVKDTREEKDTQSTMAVEAPVEVGTLQNVTTEVKPQEDCPGGGVDVAEARTGSADRQLPVLDAEPEQPQQTQQAQRKECEASSTEPPKASPPADDYCWDQVLSLPNHNDEWTPFKKELSCGVKSSTKRTGLVGGGGGGGAGTPNGDIDDLLYLPRKKPRTYEDVDSEFMADTELSAQVQNAIDSIINLQYPPLLSPADLLALHEDDTQGLMLPGTHGQVNTNFGVPAGVGHSHSHNHGHIHGTNHTLGHGLSHGPGHGHGHGHGHNHGHSHGHSHTHSHGHMASHLQGHVPGHVPGHVASHAGVHAPVHQAVHGHSHPGHGSGHPGVHPGGHPGGHPAPSPVSGHGPTGHGPGHGPGPGQSAAHGATHSSYRTRGPRDCLPPDCMEASPNVDAMLDEAVRSILTS